VLPDTSQLSSVQVFSAQGTSVGVREEGQTRKLNHSQHGAKIKVRKDRPSRTIHVSGDS
jgi:hypothetical protein